MRTALCAIHYTSAGELRKLDPVTSKANRQRIEDGKALLSRESNEKVHGERNEYFALTLPLELVGRIDPQIFQQSIQHINNVLEAQADNDDIFSFTTALALACLCCGGFCYLNSKSQKPRRELLEAVATENSRIWNACGLKLEVDTYLRTMESKDFSHGPDYSTKRVLCHEYALLVVEI